MRKTRVLMFGWEFPPYNSGGLGVACLGLTRALAERGLEVIFVMPRKLDLSVPWTRFVFADKDGKISESLDMRAVNVALTPYLTAETYEAYRRSGGMAMETSGHRPFYGPNLIDEVKRYAAMAASIALKEDFDIIYAHDWLSFEAGMEAKRVTGKPLVAHVHATEFDRCGGATGVNSEVYAIERAGMEASNRIIAVSELTKAILVRQYGIDEGKISVIYNGIDETTAPQSDGTLLRLHSLKQAGYGIVLFLGRITLQKGPDYYIRAAKRVLEHNPKVVFIISGSGDMERSMMDLAAQLGIASNVLFTGFLQGNDRYEVYAAADLFVMPSVSEPFGITPLEAMRLGTPVLISKQSGVSEVVSHALKADFWDIDEMANQILSVIGHPGLRASLAENGVREAAGLTWGLAAQKVDNVLKELMRAV
ncbi:glycosyltransferase family 4 protein [Candidatus Kaiserbacteria bacterium]|nr:glycosyltransferase family 4 protein [Candidatus Kaiserbacteria bacterium]